MVATAQSARLRFRALKPILPPVFSHHEFFAINSTSRPSIFQFTGHVSPIFRTRITTDFRILSVRLLPWWRQSCGGLESANVKSLRGLGNTEGGDHPSRRPFGTSGALGLATRISISTATRRPWLFHRSKLPTIHLGHLNGNR